MYIYGNRDEPDVSQNGSLFLVLIIALSGCTAQQEPCLDCNREKGSTVLSMSENWTVGSGGAIIEHSGGRVTTTTVEGNLFAMRFRLDTPSVLSEMNITLEGASDFTGPYGFVFALFEEGGHVEESQTGHFNARTAVVDAAGLERVEVANLLDPINRQERHSMSVALTEPIPLEVGEWRLLFGATNFEDVQATMRLDGIPSLSEPPYIGEGAVVQAIQDFSGETIVHVGMTTVATGQLSRSFDVRGSLFGTMFGTDPANGRFTLTYPDGEEASWGTGFHASAGTYDHGLLRLQDRPGVYQMTIDDYVGRAPNGTPVLVYAETPT